MLVIMLFRMHLIVLPLILGLVAAADLDANYYRRRAYHSVAVLGDRLYIDGGEISEYIDGKKPKDKKSDSYSVKNTTSIPLNFSWKTSDVHKQYQYITYPSDILPSKIFSLWADKGRNQLYRWGGEPAVGEKRKNEAPTIGKMKPDPEGKGTGNWSAATADSRPRFAPGVSGAPVTCGGMGLVFGGSVSNKTKYGAETEVSKGVLAYNMSFDTWERYGDDVSPPITQKMGEAICLEDYLDTPLVLLMGGRSTDTGSGSTQQNSLSEVTLYDPVKNKWYQQKTTGDPPEARDEFCSVGVKGSSGTYEIFIYGGQGSSKTLKDLCILTLPDFHWTCPTGVEGTLRVHHTCALAGKRHMISVGGFDSWATSWDTMDDWPNGIGIFNMAELKWQTSFDPSASDYDSPKEIKDWYKNDKREKPKWADSDVEAMFSKESSSAGNQGSGANDKDGDKKDLGPNVGAIAGGVVGGVVGLSLIAVAIWFFLRRRRQQQQEGMTVLQDSNNFGAMGMNSPKTYSYAPSYSHAASYSPVEVEARWPPPVTMNEELDGMPRCELEGNVPTASNTPRPNA